MIRLAIPGALDPDRANASDIATPSKEVAIIRLRSLDIVLFDWEKILPISVDVAGIERTSKAH